MFTKSELLRDVWDFKTMGRTWTLDSHASRLRRKLDPEGGRFVQNVWGRLPPAAGMSTPLAELSEIAGATLPVALTMAVVAVRDRVRGTRRRRALNERLHELRRPLQGAVLAAAGAGPRSRPARAGARRAARPRP